MEKKVFVFLTMVKMQAVDLCAQEMRGSLLPITIFAEAAMIPADALPENPGTLYNMAYDYVLYVLGRGVAPEWLNSD